MFTATYTPSGELLSKVALAAYSATIQDERPSVWLRAQRAFPWLLTNWVLALLLVVPLIVVLTGEGRIRGWMILYLVGMAYLFGIFEARRKQQNKIGLALQMLLQTTQPIVLRLTEIGVETENEGTVACTPWTAFKKVVVADDLVLILKKYSMHYVPASAFETRNEMLEFAKYATSKLTANAQHDAKTGHCT